MNRLTRIVLAVAAAVAVGGGISYAALSKPGGSPSGYWRVAAGLRHRFSVFSRPTSDAHHLYRAASASPAEATAPRLPASVAASFVEPEQAGDNYYPNAAEAVYERPNGAAPGFWIVPGKNGACIVWKTTTGWPMPEANCSPLAQVEERGMIAISTSNGPAELLFGFVPDGVGAVKVANAGGSTLSAPVVNNAFMVVDRTDNAESLRITIGSASGSRSHVWEIPRQGKA